MTNEELKDVAIRKTIGILAEVGIKYRKNDFNRSKSAYVDGKWLDENCFITLSGNVTLKVYFNDEKRGKKLKSEKDKFYNYFNCRVLDGFIRFTYTKKELELESIKEVDVEESKIEQIMDKVQKLLALAESDNEHEAISASLMAQKLLAKYNIDLETISGIKDEEQDIEEVKADVGTGNKWKYSLAGVVARNYRCKHYYIGSEVMAFRGFVQDIVIARRVYMYLFQVCRRLGRSYEKQIRQECGYADGIYNSFCGGFIAGVDSELSKQCMELMLVTPVAVEKEYETFSSKFGKKDTSINLTDHKAYSEGITEGKRALNAQYIDNNSKYIE